MRAFNTCCAAWLPLSSAEATDTDSPNNMPTKANGIAAFARRLNIFNSPVEFLENGMDEPTSMPQFEAGNCLT
ncbi:hypothetical protein [Acidithiobacillus sp.]|uniref:hypothetical protein n=1 Tax=Acidithiobacillus sp. TaxID=1872118 RepID=UPI00259048CA|nr:hypothetical protein [Acidithiobacillus sp.]